MSTPVESQYPFDHAVINVRDQLDSGAAVFSRLGFRVTPRGYHTLGSINHLIVLGATYVELIGFPADNPAIRAELREAPAGLNGLVFRTTDSAFTFEAAKQRGAPVLAPMQFSRPVDLSPQHVPGNNSQPAGTAGDAPAWPDAVFRTVRTETGFGPAGRLYFCEHLTPELVWRDVWRQHPNTAIELTSIEVDSTDPAMTSKQFASLVGHQSVRGSGDRYEVFAAPLRISIQRGPQTRMRLLRIRVASLDQTRASLVRSGIPFREDHTATGPIVHVSALHAGGAELEFTTRSV